MLERMPSKDLTGWQAYFAVKKEYEDERDRVRKDAREHETKQADMVRKYGRKR